MPDTVTAGSSAAKSTASRHDPPGPLEQQPQRPTAHVPIARTLPVRRTALPPVNAAQKQLLLEGRVRHVQAHLIDQRSAHRHADRPTRPAHATRQNSNPAGERSTTTPPDGHTTAHPRKRLPAAAATSSHEDPDDCPAGRRRHDLHSRNASPPPGTTSRTGRRPAAATGRDDVTAAQNSSAGQKSSAKGRRIHEPGRQSTKLIHRTATM